MTKSTQYVCPPTDITSTATASNEINNLTGLTHVSGGCHVENDRQLVSEWNAKLEELGLGEDLAGENAHVIKYGFSAQQLDALAVLAPSLDAHLSAVAENLTGFFRLTNSTRTNTRELKRREKEALRAKIWGEAARTPKRSYPGVSKPKDHSNAVGARLCHCGTCERSRQTYYYVPQPKPIDGAKAKVIATWEEKVVGQVIRHDPKHDAKYYPSLPTEPSLWSKSELEESSPKQFKHQTDFYSDNFEYPKQRREAFKGVK